MTACISKPHRATKEKTDNPAALPVQGHRQSAFKRVRFPGAAYQMPPTPCNTRTLQRTVTQGSKQAGSSANPHNPARICGDFYDQGAEMAKPKKTAAPEEIVLAYKGFDADLQCRGYQYALGGSYENKGGAEACRHGFHACEHPLNVFD